MSTTSQDNHFGYDFLESIITWIAANMQPEDVFSADVLSDWAASSDYVSESNESRIRELAAELGMVLGEDGA